MKADGILKKDFEQIALKYFGKLDDITLEDLQEPYRRNQKITAFLTSYNPRNIKKERFKIPVFVGGRVLSGKKTRVLMQLRLKI